MSTKRTDKRLVKSITDKNTGKRVYFYGKSEREINGKIINYNSEKTVGREFGAVASEWWESAHDDLAIQSIKVYRPAMMRAVEYFGGTPIKEISASDVAQYVGKLADKGYAKKTVLMSRLVVNLIFKFAVVTGEIEYNPCASVSVPSNLKREKRSAASSDDERRIRETKDVWGFPFFALLTGMRKGEILALRWEDIDLDNRLIHVTKSICHDGNTPIIKEPKTKTSVRDVPIVDDLYQYLIAFPKSVRKKEDYLFFYGENRDQPMTNDHYTMLMDAYRKETGVTATAHQLRHSFATIAFEADIPGKSVQHILGHAQLSTTMDIYTDFRNRSLFNVEGALNKAFSER